MSKLATKTQLGDALAELRRAQIYQDQLVVEMEARKAAVEKLYADRVNDLLERIRELEKSIFAYLLANKADFDGPPRSMEFVDGTVGYRLGQPHLKPLSKKWTWAKVLANLTDLGKKSFIRLTPEVDREAILAARQVLGTEGLKALGLKAAQDDKPFIEIKRDEALPKE